MPTFRSVFTLSRRSTQTVSPGAPAPLEASSEVNAAGPPRQAPAPFSTVAGRRSASPVPQRPTLIPRNKNFWPIGPKRKLFAEWDAWAKTGRYSDEIRVVAVNRMKHWVNAEETHELLNLRSLNLRSLPEHLPADLMNLDVSGNQLESLPDNLPANLRSLDAYSNRLSRLPENLPDNLRQLHADQNQLASWPDHLPANLLVAYVAGNQLSSLPRNLPVTLQYLDAADNPLTSLPENILTLPRTCTVVIDASHLSEAVRNRLSAAMAVPGYDNVRINFQMSRQRESQERSLGDEASSWAHAAGNVALSDWKAFQAEQYARQFSQFLGRLRGTGEYRTAKTRSNFHQRVGNLLQQLQDNSELRGTCFNLAHDAVDSCGDGVASRMLHMETICLDKRMEIDIKAGKFDNNPQAVLDYCKAQYRQQKLEDAASAKFKTLNYCDETEISLGFIVAFSSEFKLNAQMNAMLYAACSHLDPEDLYEARKKLTNQDFTEKTKEFYRPFFEKMGEQESIDKLNALADYKKPPSEIDAENHLFQQFLANSPAIDLLLSRGNSHYESALRNQISQEIEKESELINQRLDNLDSENPRYLQQCQILQRQYNEVPVEVNSRIKQPLLLRFCADNNVNAELV